MEVLSSTCLVRKVLMEVLSSTCAMAMSFLVWSPYYTEDMQLLRNVQRRVTKIPHGMKHLLYEDYDCFTRTPWKIRSEILTKLRLKMLREYHNVPGHQLTSVKVGSVLRCSLHFTSLALPTPCQFDPIFFQLKYVKYRNIETGENNFTTRSFLTH